LARPATVVAVGLCARAQAGKAAGAVLVARLRLEYGATGWRSSTMRSAAAPRVLIIGTNLLATGGTASACDRNW